MSYEELYNKAMNGDADALSRLIEDAEMGGSHNSILAVLPI